MMSWYIDSSCITSLSGFRGVAPPG
jgi:hypothetical protein